MPVQQNEADEDEHKDVSEYDDAIDDTAVDVDKYDVDDDFLIF